MDNRLTNPEDVHEAVVGQMPDILDCAQLAGASFPVDYVGAGMIGVVLRDGLDENVALKVSRSTRPSYFRSLEAEYEFLRAASRYGDEFVADSVVAAWDWSPDALVIKREFIEGRPGTWGDAGQLFDIHQKLASVMLDIGWGMPEFKEDSYVFDEDRGPVLVDASGPIRRGNVLLCYVEDVLAGERDHPEAIMDLTFGLRVDSQAGLIAIEDADELIQALEELL